MPSISVDDLIGFYIDGNNQDADVILGINALIMDGSTAIFGGDITHAPTCVLILKAARQFGM